MVLTCQDILCDLRSRLAIISQDSVLFTGSIQSNLDPFGDHIDAGLHDALDQLHLHAESAMTVHDGSLPLKDANSNVSLSCQRRESQYVSRPTLAPVSRSCNRNTARYHGF